MGEGRHKMSTLLWCQCNIVLFDPPASASSWNQKAVEKFGGRGGRFLNCQTSNGGRFFSRRTNRLAKLCGLVGRFMAPDEITVRSAVPWIMRVRVVLYRLRRCAKHCLVSNQSVAKSLHGTIFVFIIIFFFLLFSLWKGLKHPPPPCYWLEFQSIWASLFWIRCWY